MLKVHLNCRFCPLAVGFKVQTNGERVFTILVKSIDLFNKSLDGRSLVPAEELEDVFQLRAYERTFWDRPRFLQEGLVGEVLGCGGAEEEKTFGADYVLELLEKTSGTLHCLVWLFWVFTFALLS